MRKPLVVDLYAGLGGWSDGFLAEGYDCVGFDIERHVYGEHRYPAQLVLQDVLTLHGSQFRDAAVIVASPPCQRYSWMAMPWSLAKAKAAEIRADASGKMLGDLNALFDACFRIRREACEAAGRHIPLVVENVRGAEPWVGRARWNFGSFYLWGDVPALMPITFKGHKVPGISWSNSDQPGYVAKAFNGTADLRLREGAKNDNSGWRPNGTLKSNNRMVPDGTKCGGDWFNDSQPSISRLTSSKSPARKAASAMIAKIPEALSRHIAATFRDIPRHNKAGPPA